jgi:uncharacterized protein YciI
MKRFAYFYFMKGEPERILNTIPAHVEYLRGCNLKNYRGPFSDRSGGLITFSASDLQEAERIVSGDPFALEGLFERMWLKEWSTEDL